MKSTEQLLSEVFCKPNSREWKQIIHAIHHVTDYFWRAFDPTGKCFLYDNTVYLADGEPTEVEDRTEISVDEFLDLIHNAIAVWRLKKDGWRRTDQNGNPWVLTSGGTDILLYGVEDNDIEVDLSNESGVFSSFRGVKTYSDLITLIKLKNG